MGMNLGSSESTAEAAVMGSAIGALLVWALGIFVPAEQMATLPNAAVVSACTWLFCRYAPGDLTFKSLVSSNTTAGGTST